MTTSQNVPAKKSGERKPLPLPSEEAAPSAVDEPAVEVAVEAPAEPEPPAKVDRKDVHQVIAEFDPRYVKGVTPLKDYNIVRSDDGTYTVLPRR